ncbi:unnamed protein product [Linum trigynum]|uniref:Uncharacterized protein n=1 Tax=Linum trigynum TaxID=586398 RepID=A0AAV2E762_9ROSI
MVDTQWGAGAGASKSRSTSLLRYIFRCDHAPDGCDHQHWSARPGHPARCRRVSTRMARVVVVQKVEPSHSGLHLSSVQA